MNIKKGFFRIFAVISIIWFSFFALLGYGGFGFKNNEFYIFLAIGIVPPFIVYFLIKWISDGFFDK